MNGSFNDFGSFGNFGNQNLLAHMCNFIGQTVTIFTNSGGASGCGFTGILMSVNPCFCRLTTQQGTPPANPLSQSICPFTNNEDCHHDNTVGSVCDIPISAIVSFCHNAV